MTITAGDRKTIILGGLALGIIFAGYFVLMPWLDSWSMARAEISESRKQLGDIQVKVQRILSQRQRLKQRYGPGINRPLEDDVETAQLKLLKTVKEAFAAGGFKPNEYRLQRPRALALKSVSGIQVVPLEVPGKCNISQLTKSLAELSKAKTFVFVERFTISNDEKKPGQLEVTITVATLARITKAGS